MHGDFSSEFPGGGGVKVSLQISDLITFPVCRSSTNRLQKQDKD